LTDTGTPSRDMQGRGCLQDIRTARRSASRAGHCCRTTQPPCAILV
jgi:hypothetical protein